MTRKDVVELALAGKAVPYVPWSFGFTQEAREKLVEHYGTEDLAPIFDNHLANVGGDAIGSFTGVGNELYRDLWGVTWDRSVDKDIGNVVGQVLPEPTLANAEFPDPLDPRFFRDIDARCAASRDRLRIHAIGFSLYERAWTLRGMTTLMMDFYDNPDFAHELLNAIADWNITQVREAVKHDIDGVYYGDDWGQQHGLQMGYDLWKKFLYPPLKRMYAAVRDAGKYVFIHSCGDVDELFDDLVDIGLNCFNPFQPEVMDVYELCPRYRGRLAFHGGLSTQQTLPYGTVEDVRSECRRLVDMGMKGGYIFAPAHGVEGDVPLDNMLAFIDFVQAQPGYRELVGG